MAQSKHQVTVLCMRGSVELHVASGEIPEYYASDSYDRRPADAKALPRGRTCDALSRDRSSHTFVKTSAKVIDIQTRHHHPRYASLAMTEFE